MKKTYKIEVDCANCAAKMENAVSRIEGVTKCNVNFMTQKMTVETEAQDQSQIMQAALKACKKVEPDCEIYL
ncbi:MAG: cation transporter [Oscillospiraceae bacterium]|nr:cation transporter [Oscillospiraceae bacterium]